MMNKNIRWQQRFENYKKAFAQLENAIAIPRPNETEKAGLIQFFEIAFELAWKTLKDYLESEGVVAETPRDTIKKAFQSKIIPDGHTWIDALENRNLTVHTYDEETAMNVDELIRKKYYPSLKLFHDNFLNKKTI